MAVGADVSEADQVTAMLEEIKRELGAVDILVNNAGIAAMRRVEETTEADFDEVIKVNREVPLMRSLLLSSTPIWSHS